MVNWKVVAEGRCPSKARRCWAGFLAPVCAGTARAGCVEALQVRLLWFSLLLSPVPTLGAGCALSSATRN